MSDLDRSSLGVTLDSISESQFFGRTIPESQRLAAARWIARRHGLPGADAGMFAPNERDALGIRLFTGEKSSRDSPPQIVRLPAAEPP